MKTRSELSAADYSNGPVRPIDVSLPTVAMAVGDELVIPVRLDGAADKEIISYEFDLRYDPSVIQPLADPIDVVETASRALSVVTNAEHPGLLRVVMYGALPIDQDGVLLNLRFTAVGKAGMISPLAWERIMFNEGKSGTVAIDGQVQLTAASFLD